MLPVIRMTDRQAAILELLNGFSPTIYVLPDYTFTTTISSKTGNIESMYRNVLVQILLPSGVLVSRYVKETILPRLLEQYQRRYANALDVSCYAWMN